MSALKFLLPVLAGFLPRLTRFDQQVTLKREIFEISRKIVFGLILAALIIFCLIESGLALQTYFARFENGPIFSVIFFVSVALLGVAGVLSLFRDPFQSFFVEDEYQANPVLAGTHGIVQNFAAGFFEGFNSPKIKQIEARTVHSPQS